MSHLAQSLPVSGHPSPPLHSQLISLLAIAQGKRCESEICLCLHIYRPLGISYAGENALASSTGSFSYPHIDKLTVHTHTHTNTHTPFLFFFFFLNFFYLFMIVTERERGRDIGRGRSRLHALGARRGIRSQVSRIAPWAKGRRQTAAPPRDPSPDVFQNFL